MCSPSSVTARCSMSASTRSRLGGANGGYRRPALDILDELTDPGTSDVRVPRRTMETSDNQDTEDTSGTPDNSSTSDDSVHSGTRGTVGNSGNERPSGYSGNSAAQDTPDVSGTSDTRMTTVTSAGRGPKPTAEPRDHVKVARSLAAEMRDAVWFLSEHGRPRVQLGELLDEAVRTWLEATKAAHNDGRPFPGRGRLR